MWHVCQGKPGFVRLDVDNKEYHMYICPWGADVAASELARALSCAGGSEGIIQLC